MKGRDTMLRDQYTYLKMADDEEDLQEISDYLKPYGINIIAIEKGFGSGPLHSIFMGNYEPLHIEIHVKKSQHAQAVNALDYEAFKAELDKELFGGEKDYRKPN